MSSKAESKVPFNVAVIQAGPVGFDKAATIANLTGQASAREALLVCFPEAFISAYPKGAVFDSFVGGRSMEGREAFRRYYESAIDMPGPEREALGQIARENAVHLVIGIIERAGGTLYCTVVFFGPSGEYRGKRRKLMPTGTERLMWGWLYAAGFRYRSRQDRRRHLLGKLYAHASHGDVREGDRNILCAHTG